MRKKHWTAYVVDGVLGFVIALGVLTLIALAFLAISVRTGRAHHWYDAVCCSGQDCFALEDGEVTVLPGNAYLIVSSGEVFAHPDNPQFERRARWSKDSRFHRCTIGGDRSAPASLCLYVPPPSF